MAGIGILDFEITSISHLITLGSGGVLVIRIHSYGIAVGLAQNPLSYKAYIMQKFIVYVYDSPRLREIR